MTFKKIQKLVRLTLKRLLVDSFCYIFVNCFGYKYFLKTEDSVKGNMNDIKCYHKISPLPTLDSYVVRLQKRFLMLNSIPVIKGNGSYHLLVNRRSDDHF